MSSAGVTVVVPAFNEEEAIAATLRAIAQQLQRCAWDHEILVVDDGSTDDTARIAEESGARVICLRANGGYGAALKVGVKLARYPWILITDADGTYPEEAIPELLALSQNAEMVVGARIGARVHIPWERRPAKRLLTWYASWIVGRRIPDLNSGMRLMSRAAVLEFWDLLPSRFSFTSTITLALLGAGRRVEYLSINYRPRIGRSKIRSTDFFRILWLITRMALRFRPYRLLVPAISILVVVCLLLDFPAMLLSLTFGIVIAGAERARE